MTIDEARVRVDEVMATDRSAELSAMDVDDVACDAVDDGLPRIAVRVTYKRMPHSKTAWVIHHTLARFDSYSDADAFMTRLVEMTGVRVA
jgi:hypothetical protein